MGTPGGQLPKIGWMSVTKSDVDTQTLRHGTCNWILWTLWNWLILKAKMWLQSVKVNMIKPLIRGVQLLGTCHWNWNWKGQFQLQSRRALGQPILPLGARMWPFLCKNPSISMWLDATHMVACFVPFVSWCIGLGPRILPSICAGLGRDLGYEWMDDGLFLGLSYAKLILLGLMCIVTFFQTWLKGP